MHGGGGSQRRIFDPTFYKDPQKFKLSDSGQSLLVTLYLPSGPTGVILRTHSLFLLLVLSNVVFPTALLLLLAPLSSIYSSAYKLNYMVRATEFPKRKVITTR